jgi:F-type H+-transporting ATPase subunit b
MDQAIQVLTSFGVDWPKFITTTINFIIVLAVLHRFAYKPLLAMLDERRNRIDQSLKDAEKIKQELKQTEAARKETLEKAFAQAERMIQDAKLSAAKVEEKKIQEATAQAEEIVRKAHAASVQDREKQFLELKKQIGGLVVDTTARVVGKVLTPEDEKRLQEETARAVNA